MEYGPFGRTRLKVSAIGTRRGRCPFRTARAPGPSSMIRAQNARREAALSRSLAACQSVNVGGGHRLAADAPVAALHLFDQAKRDLAHVLALDRDHCVSQLADDLSLLFLTEHVFDNLNLNERH